MRIFFLCALGLTLVSQPLLAQQRGPSKPTSVFVADVNVQEISDEVEALGTLRASENVDLTSTVTELVTKINFDDGQRVVRGDVLVEMDNAQELAELAEEQSRLREAQSQFTRFETLLKRGATSSANVDERRRELQIAQARIKAIQSRIDERRIVAPFDGVVGLRNVSVGALVQPGTLITTIDKDDEMKLDFSVPEVFLPAIRPGLRIAAEARAFPDEVFMGRISSVDSRINPITRSLIARAIIDNPERKLKPGLLMRVVLAKNPRQSLIIPEESLVINGNNSFIFVIQEGEDGKTTVDRRRVELGTRKAGSVEIITGVSAGEQIVTHGTLKLRPGAEVTVTAIDTGQESLQELLSQSSKAETKS